MLAGIDFKINIDERNCKGCSFSGIVKHFEGVVGKTNGYIGNFGFLIGVEDGILKNIYRCLKYKETKKVWIKPEGLPGIFMKLNKEQDW